MKILYLHIGLPKCYSTTIQENLKKSSIQLLGKPNTNKLYFKLREYLLKLPLQVFNYRLDKIAIITKKILKIDTSKSAILSDEGLTNFFRENYSFSLTVLKYKKLFEYFGYQIKYLLLIRAPNSFIPSYYGTMGTTISEKLKINYKDYLNIIVSDKNSIIYKQFDIINIVKELLKYKQVIILPIEKYYYDKEEFLKEIEIFFDKKIKFDFSKKYNNTSQILSVKKRNLIIRGIKKIVSLQKINFSNFINLLFKVELRKINYLSNKCVELNLNDYYNASKLKKLLPKYIIIFNNYYN